MTIQPDFPGLFRPEQTSLPLEAPRPCSEKQIRFAEALSKRSGAPLPGDVLRDRTRLSAWIDAHKPRSATGRFSQYPSSRQVAFAERIARIRRREIPRECFRDKKLMSGWIDANKPAGSGSSHPLATERNAVI